MSESSLMTPQQVHECNVRMTGEGMKPELRPACKPFMDEQTTRLHAAAMLAKQMRRIETLEFTLALVANWIDMGQPELARQAALDAINAPEKAI